MKTDSIGRSILAALLVLAPAAGAQAASAGDYTICIDPGHGGNDPGAMCYARFGCTISSLEVNGNLEEADVVLDIGKKLRTYLQNAGFKAVYMTRDTDATVSLSERSSYANSKGCTRFVSIHDNSSGTPNTATGVETYCYSGDSTSSKGCVQAQNIQTEVLKVWPITNRGRKQANFHVVRETNMPATLTELGFINNCNPDVNSYLSVASKRTDAARAHLYALQTSLGLTQGNGGTVDDGGGIPGGGGSSVTTGTARGVLFQDVGVGTNDMSTRISGGTVTVSGKSVTTDGSGNWSFEGLAPGTVTLTGSASGYDTATKSCTITAGGTAWCSFGLKKSNTQNSGSGTIIGVVYDAVKAAAVGSTSDASVRLPNASVENVNTGIGYALSDSGKFEFTVVGGQAYTIRASLGGYETAERTCTGVEGSQQWCSFGLTPKNETVTTGILKGVVYQNGSTSDLVYPASVALNGGVSTSYSGASEWIFTDLRPGTYSVTVSAAGYETRTYACPESVTAGGSAQCNVELTRVPGGEEPGDADAGSGEGPAEDASAPYVDPSDPSEVLDPSEPGENMPDTGSGSGDAPQGLTISGGGCSSAEGDVGGAAGFGLTLLALGGFLFRRRSAAGAAAVAASMAALGLSACGEAEDCQGDSCRGAQASLEKKGPEPKVAGMRPLADIRVADAVRVEVPFVRAGRAETVAEGGWMAPVFSPDGEALMFTREKMKGLYLRELSTPAAGRRAKPAGSIRTLTDADGAGFAPRFSRDGKRIAYRVPGQKFHAMPQQLIDRSGKAARPFHLTHQVWVWATDDDTIVLRQGTEESVISASALDRFYRPFLTPDSRWVIYNGLHTGVYGYRIADGKTVFFGAGSHAAVSEDGRYLAFTRTEDDGSEVTRAVLQIADLRDENVRLCSVDLGDEIVLHPTISTLHSMLAFSDNDGRIRMAPLEIDP